jgi:hypothetical protein
MWPEMRHAFVLLIPVLVAFTALGLLAGAVARSGAGGLALALGGLAFLVVLRVPAQVVGVEGWLPTTHLPLPGDAGDRSIVHSFIQTTQVTSNADDRYADLHVAAPLAWAAAAFAATALIVRRRSVR